MPDQKLADDLHATSEAIVADAKRIEDIEAQKEHLDPDDPQVHLLSARSEKLMRSMLPKAVMETELAKRATREKQ
jgi:hypothetical protein